MVKFALTSLLVAAGTVAVVAVTVRRKRGSRSPPLANTPQANGASNAAETGTPTHEVVHVDATPERQNTQMPSEAVTDGADEIAQWTKANPRDFTYSHESPFSSPKPSFRIIRSRDVGCQTYSRSLANATAQTTNLELNAPPALVIEHSVGFTATNSSNGMQGARLPEFCGSPNPPSHELRTSRARMSSRNLKKKPSMLQRPAQIEVDSINIPSSTHAMKKTLNWKKGQCIGRGASGTVCVGLNLDTAELMAVKTIEFDPDDPSLQQRIAALQREITLLRQLNHEYIVKYFFNERVGNSMNIFMEYVPGGSLAGLVDAFGPLEETVTAMYTRQMLQGLAYLESRSIVHGDVKGANVLLTIQGTIKIADFGSATMHNSPGGLGAPAMVGTPLWMSPEAIRGQNLTPRTDVWSLGCVVMELVTGANPWDHLELPPYAVLVRLCDESAILDLPENLSPELTDFLTKCLRQNSTQRSTAVELLRHPWIQRAAEDVHLDAASAQDLLRVSVSFAYRSPQQPALLPSPNPLVSPNLTVSQDSPSNPTEENQLHIMQFINENLNHVRGLHNMEHGELMTSTVIADRVPPHSWEPPATQLSADTPDGVEVRRAATFGGIDGRSNDVRTSTETKEGGPPADAERKIDSTQNSLLGETARSESPASALMEPIDLQ